MNRDRIVTFDTMIQERLFERRIVVVQGVVDDELATRTAAQVLTLEAMAAEPIRLHLSASSGELGAVLSLVDSIRMLGVELTSVAVGEVSGAAVGVLAAAPVRLAYPHARFALREPKAAEVQGTATEIDTHAREYLRLRDVLVDVLAEATGRQAEAVTDDLRKGRFLTAEQSVGYGLVHRLVSPHSQGSGRS